MPINFVTFELLNRLLIQNLHRIPRDIDVVVGVPRSGLLNAVKNRLALVNVEKIYLAAIVEPRAIQTVDLFFAVVPQPRMFEWNFMHHSLLINCCLDFDGVLYQDPTPEQNDDGENYRKFILNAPPKFLPSQPVGRIVTARLKKYVEETQFWLRKNNVLYGALIMLDMDSAEERRKLNIHAEFKAQVFVVEDAEWSRQFFLRRAQVVEWAAA